MTDCLSFSFKAGLNSSIARFEYYWAGFVVVVLSIKDAGLNV